VASHMGIEPLNAGTDLYGEFVDDEDQKPRRNTA